MKVKLFIIFATIKFVFGESSDDVLGLIETAGYKGKVHEVKSEDGYYLRLHRVLPTNENRKKFPVFLMHGLFAAAADFVVTGPKIALAYLLADNGYDVWMGNARGNKHSTFHQKFPPNSREFWDFSWHEIGFYDLPAMIDFMLKETNSSKAFYVGHSQGTTSLMVLLSTRPEYNDKIIQAHLLSPAVFIANSPHPIARIFGEQIRLGLFHGFTFLEFGKLWDLAKEFSKIFCNEYQQTTLALCEGIIFGIVGANRDGVEISTKILDTLIQHISPRISVKQLEHFSQSLLDRKFRQFDYQWRNIARYNSTTPPDYNLNNVLTQVYLYHAAEDLLVSRLDVEHLKNVLPNVQLFRIIRNWNHIDFTYGKNSRKVLYKDILNSFEYTNATESSNFT